MGLWSGALGTTATIALGAAGAVALTVLYLLRLRRREALVPFAALWLGAQGARRRTRWAERVRQWLSLVLALAIYGLVLLAAYDPRPAARDGAGRSLVILIDRSASMAARDEVGTRLAAARARAHEIVGGLYPADRALIASFAADTVAESGFEADPARLGRAIDAVVTAGETGELDRALGFAAAVLRGHPHPTIVLVSDGGFPPDALRATAALPPKPIAGGSEPSQGSASIDTRFVSVGRRARNVGILSFAARRIPADPGQVETALAVENFGDAARPVLVQLRAGGSPVDRLTLTLAAHERRRLALDKLFAPDARLEAELLAPDGRPLAATEADDLAADDRASAVVPPLRRRRVLRVGEPDLYLDGALLSMGRAIIVERMTAAAAEAIRNRWPSYDLVIFTGLPPAPAPTTGRYLYFDPHGPGSPFVERGRVRDPILGETRRDHPLLRQIDLSDVNISEARRLALAAGDVAVAGSFGVPLVIARERPGLLLAAVSFDPRRSDLPMRPAFPLLIANTLAWAAREAPATLDEPTGVSLDTRESDTTPARTLTLGERTLSPPDPPARRAPVRLTTLALWLAAALLVGEWVSYHRRWTT
jgi:hypothetical protein